MIDFENNTELLTTIRAGRGRRIVVRRDRERGGLFIFAEIEITPEVWQRRGGWTLIPASALPEFTDAVAGALAQQVAGERGSP